MTVTAEPDVAVIQAWQGPLAIEGAVTGDGRIVEHDALSWRDLPLPLMFQRTTPAGGNPHAGATIAGRIDLIWREGASIMGAGVFDSADDGQEAARLVGEQTLKGISVDLDDVTAEVDEAAKQLRIKSGRIMGATATPFPAIPGAEIGLLDAEAFAALASTHGVELADVPMADHPYKDDGSGKCATCGQPADAHPMAASAAPALPPEAWFSDPDLHGPTPLTITDEGRVFGHAFVWGLPHIALPGRTAPKSPSAYAYFRTGATRASCDCPERGGQVEVPTGVITLGTDHGRNLRASARAAQEHYERTGLAVADVAVGEDQFGGWVAGALRPSVPDDKVRELRGASLSGDWRFIGGRLDLVALLAVNVPGFPIPREAFHVDAGRETALVAAGVVLGDASPGPVSEAEPTTDLSDHFLTQDEFAERLARIERVVEPALLDPLAERLGIVDGLATKTEDGVAFPKGDYAYTPSDNPSDWKLRLTSSPGGAPDPGIVGAAAAALGAGFRGNKVQIPASALGGVKAKVRSAWKQANPDKSADEMPDSLRP